MIRKCIFVLMTADSSRVPRFRLGLLLWLAGMLGVVVITITVLPAFLKDLEDLPAPLWMISLASLAQSAVLVALAAWAGVALAPAVGLHAPGFEAAAAGRPIVPALRPQLLPGLLSGVLGGVVLFAAFRYAPAAVVEIQRRFSPSLPARVLYGGITEELLLRWGFMTLLVWLVWRFAQHRLGAPRAGYVWIAILVSSLVFAAGHLPAAAVLAGVLTADIVAFVIVVNTAFGVLFGYLFWRYGLEAAIIAHATAHVVSYVVGLL
ncbi:MAG TPA: CPBP family glutamic-type intramembrane protease [Thermoanaerobaculia bacterium]|nr:CPBP family glutamic-type intramembrane protease [Thermoanaerobaculia bacterium]